MHKRWALDLRDRDVPDAHFRSGLISSLELTALVRAGGAAITKGSRGWCLEESKDLQPLLSLLLFVNMDFDPDFAEEVYESIVSDEINYGVLALVIYEYIITFDHEITIVWKNKFTLTSALLVAIRWSMVANVIIDSIPPSTDLGCRASNRLENVVIWIEYGGAALFSALRVSAIWDRNWFLFALILSLGSIPIWTNIYTAARSEYGYTAKFGGCWQDIYYSDHVVTVLHLTTRISLIAMDFLVLILTWIKTFSQWRESRRLGISRSITESLLRDGTIYFLLLLGVNLAQILTYDLTFAPVNLLIAVMPSVLVSRFLINLRQIASSQDTAPSDGLNTVALSQFSAPHFRAADSVFGNLGEPIGFGEAESEFDDFSEAETTQGGLELREPYKDDVELAHLDVVPHPSVGQEPTSIAPRTIELID